MFMRLLIVIIVALLSTYLDPVQPILFTIVGGIKKLHYVQVIKT